MKYGFKCPCHGVQIFETQDQRDAFAALDLRRRSTGGPRPDGPDTKVQTFRKKPAMVEAMQWTGDNVAALESWTDAAFIAVDDRSRPDVTGELYVAFSGAYVGVTTHDWILRDANGFYPCKPEVFAETYEPSLIPSLLDETGTTS